MVGIACSVCALSLCAIAEENAPAQTDVRASGGKGGRIGTFPDETITVGKLVREYRLVVPDSVNSQTPVPIVFAFHGYLIDSKDFMPFYTRFDQLAKEQGFIVVYLNGRNRAWPLITWLAKPDFAFFDTLYAKLTSLYNIDLSRVYVIGMSNGAYFANLLASQRPDKIAAIACHSGGLGFMAASEMKLKNKYGVIVIHGKRDGIVNVEEGRKTRDAYLKWGHPVEYVEVPLLGHTWATMVDVNHKIWKFFERHPLESMN